MNHKDLISKFHVSNSTTTRGDKAPWPATKGAKRNTFFAPLKQTPTALSPVKQRRNNMAEIPVHKAVPSGLRQRNDKLGFFVKSPYVDNYQFVVIGQRKEYGQAQFETLPQSGHINTECLVTGKPFLVKVNLRLEVKKTTATDSKQHSGNVFDDKEVMLCS